MKLKEGEIKVFHNLDFDESAKVDKHIEKTLKKLGYRRWASGIDMTTGVRDLAFDKGNKNDNQS